jgi:GPI ethanolamine phosphate transferase 1
MVIVGLAYLALADRLRAGSPSQRTKQSGLGLVTRTIVGFQVGLIMLAMFVTRSSAMSLQAKQGLPKGNQAVGWLVFVISFLTPLAYRFEQNDGWYFHRLVSMFLTCAPTFIILTISYEGLFYFAFWTTLLVWVLLEHKVYQLSRSQIARPAANGTKARAANGTAKLMKKQRPIYRPLRLSDARVALFFFVLLQAAFFSTGNIASISAFSLESVYRLLPVFDPFSQGALLIVKIMIPFALISANLGILNKRLGVAPSSLFMLVMAISDVLTLYFFWVVKDEGSWLEIGSTISHFVIASLLCVFVALLEGVSAIFIRGVELEMDETNSAATNVELDGTKAEAVQAEGAAIAR